jgi:hypothetical protein
MPLPSEGSAIPRDSLKTRVLQIAAMPFIMLLGLILIFDLKRMEEEERQRELDL